ncbi:MAG: chorismate-binding protein, partial [Nitriliruptorales bacterium]
MTAAVPRLRTAAHRVDGPLEDLVADRDASVWLRGGEGFVGRGAALRVDLGTGPDRFRRAGESLAALAPEVAAGADTPPVALASFTFDARSNGSVLVVPELLVARRGEEAWVRWAGDGEPDLEAVSEKDPVPDRVRYAGSSIPDLLWLDAVATAVDRIRGGALDKVVLARDHAVWSETPFSPRRLVRRLAERFPSCFTFLVDGFVGATPELLVRRTGRSLESQVFAGTAPRGEDAAADQRLGEGLLGSEKDREEHRLAASSVRDVLAELCEDLEMDPEPRLVKLDNVQHLATRFEGRLRAPVG